MTVSRFRSVQWVAVSATAALGCYLVTQQVAGERAELARVERQIMRERLAIRDLETELGTRASLTQIERWSGNILALSAPKAEQFIESDYQLASLGRMPDPTAETKVVQVARAEPARPAAVAVEQPMLRQANYMKPAGADTAALQRASLDSGLLDADALAEISSIARAERAGTPKRP